MQMHTKDMQEKTRYAHKTCSAITSAFRCKDTHRVEAVTLHAFIWLRFDIRQAAVRQLCFLFLHPSATQIKSIVPQNKCTNYTNKECVCARAQTSERQRD